MLSNDLIEYGRHSQRSANLICSRNQYDYLDRHAFSARNKSGSESRVDINAGQCSFIGLDLASDSKCSEDVRGRSLRIEAQLRVAVTVWTGFSPALHCRP